MRNFKNYIVWERSHELTLKIYKEIAPYFPENEKYGLANQIRRAAYSIPFNISEGCGRSSGKDFAHFLDISLGSAHELEYSLLLTKDLLFINEDQFRVLNDNINEIKAMIINLIKKVRSENQK